MDMGRPTSTAVPVAAANGLQLVGSVAAAEELVALAAEVAIRAAEQPARCHSARVVAAEAIARAG